MKEALRRYTRSQRDYIEFLGGRRTLLNVKRSIVSIHTWRNELRLLADYPAPEAHIQAFEMAVKTARGLKVPPHELRLLLEDWPTTSHLLERNQLAVAPVLVPPQVPNHSKSGLSAISLFSGALGLDLGFVSAGFRLALANDIDPASARVAADNLPKLPFLTCDCDSLSVADVTGQSGLSRGDIDVLIGGPPCQPFSTAGKRQGFNDPRASPLRVFVQMIKDLQPRAFVMEEVPGLTSARLVHVPIAERSTHDTTPETQPGSVFRQVLKMLDSTGYRFTWARLNAADYGAPQVRNRLVFIGLRDGVPTLPQPTHSGDFSALGGDGRLLPWRSFWEATCDLREHEARAYPLAVKSRSLMSMVPPGGNWRSLPEDLQRQALGGAFESGGGKVGFLRRLSWDSPAPTVVTSPNQRATSFAHPEADRYLSIQEYKRVQGFPDMWHIPGSMAEQYRLIGNAVPVHLSSAIAQHVKVMLSGR